MKKIIAIDIDDVLCDSIWSLIKFYDWKINWVNIQFEEFCDIWLNKIPKLNIKDSKQALKIRNNFFLHSKEFQNLKPKLSVIKKIKQRKKSDYKIFFVTWRVEILKDLTTKRIDKYFGWLYEKLIFTNQWTNKEIKKTDILKKNWIWFLIDDYLPNFENIDKYWMTWFLIEKPRNKNFETNLHKWITKVKSLEEIKL